MLVMLKTFTSFFSMYLLVFSVAVFRFDASFQVTLFSRVQFRVWSYGRRFNHFEIRVRGFSELLFSNSMLFSKTTLFWGCNVRVGHVEDLNIFSKYISGGFSSFSFQIRC